jgi:uracil permease
MPAHESATDYAFRPKDSLVGAQMLFVAFGALVLVPLLTGLNPNVALFTAGAGTLIFQFITKRMVPIFLASSFAFIAPIIHGVNTWGIPGTMCGLAAAGLLYVVLSLCIKTFGAGFLHRLLPPVVVGPVIMVIGLVLAPVAVHMAMGRTGDGAAWLVPQSTAMIVAGTALFVTVITSLLGKGWFRLIPILIGIGAGYVAALILDLIGISGSIQSGFDPGALKNFTGPALVSFKPLIDAPGSPFPILCSPSGTCRPSFSSCRSPLPRPLNISATFWPSAASPARILSRNRASTAP